MPGVFKILIVDSDKFFSKGLSMSIENYFSELSMPFIIRETKHSYRMADLIFWAPHGLGAALPSGLLRDKGYMSKLVVVMTQLGARLTQQYEPAFLYRHQGAQVVSEIIDRAITAKSKAEVKIPEHVLMNKLTNRQRQILHYISKGMYSTEIANILNIDCKTVSSHKRSAMAKLSISRTTDLYQWLLMDSNMLTK